MTREGAIKELKKLLPTRRDECYNQEQAHKDADQVLCSLLQALGYGDVVEEYHLIPKWFA